MHRTAPQTDSVLTETPPHDPAPLLPPDCDLRNFAFMPLDVMRLRDSDLAAEASGDAFRAAVLLWCAAWHQIPAASLPDDDAKIAHLAGYGRAAKQWAKIRDDALHGFLRCADGRLYHPVVASKAAEAWASRERFAEKREQDRERLRRWRDQKRGATTDETATPEAGNADETRLTAERESEQRVTADAGAQPLDDITIRLCRIGGVPHRRPAAVARNRAIADGWLRDGFDVDTDIVPVLRQRVAEAKEPVSSLGYYDAAVRQRRAQGEARSQGKEASPQPIDFTKPGEPASHAAFRADIATRIGAAAYRFYFDRARFMLECEHLCVVAENAFCAARAGADHGVAIERLALLHFGRKLVRFDVSEKEGG